MTLNPNLKLVLLHCNGQVEAKSIRRWSMTYNDWDSPFMGNDWSAILAEASRGQFTGSWSGGTWRIES